MNSETNLSAVIDSIDSDKAKYDKNIKEFLSDIQILARIVKYTVKEVEHLSIDEIMGCIDSKSIDTGNVRVNPGRTNLGKIECCQTENSIQGEGYITFDIRFILFYKEKEIKIIINIEAQKSADEKTLGYHLENRVIFYLARLISSQKETQFFHSNYDDIKKVYSIWICMDAKENEEGISKISLNAETVYGNEMLFPELDKVCGVIVRIRKEDGKKSKNKLIAMLEDLLSSKDKGLKKKLMTDEYKMVMTTKLERSVDDMCNLSTVVEEKGIQKGIEEGETLLASLMSKLYGLGRDDDAKLAVNDEKARKKFYEEFGLIKKGV